MCLLDHSNANPGKDQENDPVGIGIYSSGKIQAQMIT